MRNRDIAETYKRQNNQNLINILQEEVLVTIYKIMT